MVNSERSKCAVRGVPEELAKQNGREGLVWPLRSTHSDSHSTMLYKRCHGHLSPSRESLNNQENIVSKTKDANSMPLRFLSAFSQGLNSARYFFGGIIS